MNWFRENRFLGAFLTALLVCTFGCTWFLLSARGEWEEASNRFNQTATELNRLERSAPYPSRENLRKMTEHVVGYAAILANLNEELKVRVLPVPQMAPNEFQSHLRRAMTGVAEKARANKVRLPDRFHLGFDEFVSALPNEAAAPLLGQELAQIEWLAGTVIDARVDALTVFRRVPLPEEHGTEPASRPSPVGQQPSVKLPPAPRLLERNVVEATFVSTPAAARRVLNQVAGAKEQFCIIRLLHVRNERDKGPPREVAGDRMDDASPRVSSGSAGLPDAKQPATTALNFIVGNERIETSVTIEMVRFTF